MATGDILVIFDIDGTLTQTNAVDNLCFREAHAAHLGTAALAEHWGNFTHQTDSSINLEIFQRVLARPPAEHEIAQIQQDFLDRLQRAHATDPQAFAEVRGAAATVQRLTESPHHQVTLATGGWGLSATYKLGLIGINARDFVAAFGHEFVTREELVQAAIDRAGIAKPGRTVSVGDGVWDVATARRLRLPFVGIATGDKATALRAAGAGCVITDYRSPEAFDAALAEAEVPHAV